MGIPELIPNQPDTIETSNMISLFPVLFHVCTLVGAPFAGTLSDRFGRKPVIIIACLLFTIGAIVQSVAQSYLAILLGRCLGGFGSGFTLTVIPVYTAELSPERMRGKISGIFNFSMAFGIFLAALLNQFVQHEAWGWRFAIGFQALPAVLIVFVTAFVFPESPSFLVKVGKFDRAKHALGKLCKGCKGEDVIVGFQIQMCMQEAAETSALGVGSFRDLFQDTPTLLCGLMVSFCVNATGVNFFSGYGTQLFSSLGYQPFLMDLVLKSSNVLGTIIAFFLIDRCGRKSLTIWGTLIFILIFSTDSLLITATRVDITAQSQETTTRAVQAFIAVSIVFFQCLFGACWGIPGWVVPGEIFPLRVRGKGMSIAIIANMCSNIFFGDYGFQALNAATNLSTTLGVIALVNITIVLSTTVLLQPETSQLSLEEMHRAFAYKLHGGEETGTMRQFFRRNALQSWDIIRCKPADPRSHPF